MPAQILERAAAIVPGGRIARLARERPFVTQERFLGTFQLQERVAALEQRLRGVGLQRKRLVVAYERLVVTVQLRQHVAAIDERRREVGLDRERLAETLQRLLWPLEGLQRATPVVQGIDRFRIDPDRLVHDPLGIRELAALKMNKAEQLKRVEIPRVRAQDLLIEPRRLVEVSGLMQTPGIL